VYDKYSLDLFFLAGETAKLFCKVVVTLYIPAGSVIVLDVHIFINLILSLFKF